MSDFKSFAPVEVSVVLPFYNEGSVLRAERLKRTSFALHSILDREFSDAYEIIGVNDGSVDGSDIIAMHAGLTVINSHPSGLNHGKGTAVLAGLEAAKGKVRIFTDADGSYVLRGDSYRSDTILGLYQAIKSGSDIALARRAESTKAHDGAVRSFGHFTTAKAFELIAWTGVSDPQAGAKALSALAAEQLVKLMPREQQRYGTDRTMLHLARQLGMTIGEVDTEIDVAGESHVSPWRDTWKMVGQAFEARRLGEQLHSQLAIEAFELSTVA
jgi:dolichyl-phosphate beta-glucosyltransferase